MRIGMIGLGKLGLPVALAIEAEMHEVKGFDTNPAICDMVQGRGTLPYMEANAQELLDTTDIEIARPADIAEWADIVFVAVQTPHQPQFEGTTRMTDERADFDYAYLKTAVHSVRNSKLV